MVVLDASALIPLARIARLDLITSIFDRLSTTEEVREEVVTQGQPGAAALADFLEDVTIHAAPEQAPAVANLEGLTVADASVILLAEQRDDALLANDKALIEVARSHGVACWLVTSLVVHGARTEILTAQEAQDVLEELVEAGMNLSPQVFVRIRRKLDDLGSNP